ncbi:21431_t:CDS:1, partial [Cetraspora pellucida]
DRYKNEAYERSMESEACDNTIGQFDPIEEISGKKKDEWSKIKFMLP